MLLPEAIEYVQSSTGGGVMTDESRLEIKFTENLLRIGRAICIKELYRFDNTLDEIYYQHIQLKYDPKLQDDDCHVIFEHPHILGVNPNIDGHQYAGTRRGDNSWRRVLSSGSLSVMKRARGQRMRVTATEYLLEPQFGTMRVLDPEVRAGSSYSILEDPLHPLANFNRQKDQYPITLECLALIEKYFREGKLKDDIRVPMDVVSNSLSEGAMGQQQPQQQQ